MSDSTRSSTPAMDPPAVSRRKGLLAQRAHGKGIPPFIVDAFGSIVSSKMDTKINRKSESESVAFQILDHGLSTSIVTGRVLADRR
jgi:hypothetical protein